MENHKDKTWKPPFSRFAKSRRAAHSWKMADPRRAEIQHSSPCMKMHLAVEQGLAVNTFVHANKVEEVTNRHDWWSYLTNNSADSTKIKFDVYPNRDLKRIGNCGRNIKNRKFMDFFIRMAYQNWSKSAVCRTLLGSPHTTSWISWVPPWPMWQPRHFIVPAECTCETTRHDTPLQVIRECYCPSEVPGRFWSAFGNQTWHWSLKHQWFPLPSLITNVSR